jgi:hypothetical protein
MNERVRLTPVALGSAALAALPLVSVFVRYTWIWQSALVLAAMGVTGVVVRRFGTARWTPTVAMALSAALTLAALFPGRDVVALVRAAAAQLRRFAAPIGDHEPVLFLTVAGVAALALLVDALVVELRRPALAGLPMLAAYTVPVAVVPGPTAWFPFALGALGFVSVLAADRLAEVRAFGRRLGGTGRTALAAAARRLALLGVALAVALPFLLPAALPGPGGTVGGAPFGGADPTSVSMLALLSGELNRPRTVDLLKVTDLDDPSPPNLRLGALEQLTSRGFEPLPPGGAAPFPAPRDPVHRAEIEVGEQLDAGILPVYPTPTAVRGLDPSWVFDPRTQMVYSQQHTTANLHYAVSYARADPTPDELRRAAPVDPAFGDTLSVPPNLVVRSLVPTLIEGRTTEFDKVEAIRAFFSPANHFVYDTSTGADTGGAAITDFLRNRRGFCAQYAAAFAWLLREAGIPARVAIGFTRGTRRSGNTTTLTNRDLHAWTEVFFPGFGWLPFDATPPGFIAGSSVPAPVSPAPAAATATPAAGPPVDSAGLGPADEDPPAARPSPIWSWGAGGLLLALLALPALVRARTRRRRLALAARSDAHAAWDELLATMRDYRVATVLAETPRATAERLLAGADLPGPARAGVIALRQAEEHARYAARPPTFRDLNVAVGAVRSGLAVRASRWARLRAVLLPGGMPPSSRRRAGRR